MKRLLPLLAAFVLCGCGAPKAPERGLDSFAVVCGDQVLHGTFSDTEAARELQKKLPVALTLEPNTFEHWGALGFSLPEDDEKIKAEAGDVLLYAGSNLCIFYGTNTYRYTRIGKIDATADELKAFFGTGSVRIEIKEEP